MLTLLLALPAAFLPQNPAPADLVVRGRLFTADLELPRAEALAIRGDTIVAVGTRAEIDALVGPDTRVVDAGEASVVPGFNDAHCHFTVAFGIEYDVDLMAAESLEEILALLGTYVTEHPDDEVIMGAGWDLADMPGEEFPTRRMLDEVAGERKVVLFSEGPHAVWASSAALDKAGITAEREDTPHTIYLRDPDTGEPSGVVLGRGLLFLFPFVGFPDLGAVRAGIDRGVAEASRLGVTTVQEPVSPFLVPYLAKVHERGDLTVRVHVWGSFSRNLGGGPERHLKLAERYGRGDWITFGALKGGVDGMPGLRTAAMLAPYADDASTKGIFTFDLDALQADLKKANAAGVPVAFHATGDAGVRACLDAVAEVDEGERLRNRIEHAFVVDPADVKRFAELGVVASVQPGFLCTELAKSSYYDRRFGAARRANVLPLRSLLDAGCVVAFGTDFSLTPLNPMVGLYGAVARQTLDGAPEGGWVPDERITLAEAVRAYTYGSAYAEGAEGRKGRLLPGMLADVVVLSEDIFTVEPERLPEVEVAITIVGGKLVFGGGR